jgi:hypothetical protein
VGLDMYLMGRKFFTYDNRKVDDEGYEIEEIVVKLGYWRKHANLHGFIVETFGPKDEQGAAVDDCEPIDLSLEQLQRLLEVVKTPVNMPPTTGFFFGASSNDAAQVTEDTAIFAKAIAFLTAPGLTGEKGVWRAVAYRASW